MPPEAINLAPPCHTSNPTNTQTCVDTLSVPADTYQHAHQLFLSYMTLSKIQHAQRTRFPCVISTAYQQSQLKPSSYTHVALFHPRAPYKQAKPRSSTKKDTFSVSGQTRSKEKRREAQTGRFAQCLCIPYSMDGHRISLAFNVDPAKIAYLPSCLASACRLLLSTPQLATSDDKHHSSTCNTNVTPPLANAQCPRPSSLGYMHHWTQKNNAGRSLTHGTHRGCRIRKRPTCVVRTAGAKRPTKTRLKHKLIGVALHLCH